MGQRLKVICSHVIATMVEPLFPAIAAITVIVEII